MDEQENKSMELEATPVAEVAMESDAVMPDGVPEVADLPADAPAEPEEAKAEKGPMVYLAMGAGATAKEILWLDGDTVGSVLDREKVRIPHGKWATLGKVRVKNLHKTPVQPGDVIVVEGKPGNG